MLVTHTYPSPVATELARSPTSIDWTTAFEAGSMRRSLSSGLASALSSNVDPNQAASKARRAATATMGVGNLRRLGGAASPSAARDSVTSCWHVSCRSAGSFARALATTASMADGRSGRLWDTTGGSSSRCENKIAMSDRPPNGGSPVRHSTSRQPSEYKSARPSSLASGDLFGSDVVDRAHELPVLGEGPRVGQNVS